MATEDPKQVAIILLEEEGLFLDLLQRFPARRFPVVFAPTLPDALELCETASPRLLIAPLNKSTEDLKPLLTAARAADARILGLGAADGVPAELAEMVDQLATPDDPPRVLDAAAALLEERRSTPRARVSIPVTVGKLGKLTATVISARSLFLPTETPLRGGQMVQITVESGGGTLTCWGSVLRVGKGELGESGMVLGIPERERAVRAHLDGLVRGALLLEHVENTPGSGKVPDGAGKKLSDRLNRDVAVLRDTLQAQMALTDALSDRLDALVAADARTVKWQDVKPLLARKLSTQQEQIKSLLERVDDLSANHSLATELRETLQTHGELEEKLHQQQQVIDALRRQIDELKAGEGRAAGPRPATIQGLSQIIHHLLARVEHLESAGAPGAEPAGVARAGEMLAAYGERIAQLSSRMERLQDQLRLRPIEPDQAAELQSSLEQGQRELQEQLAAMERGDWVPIPQVPDFDLPADDEPTVPGVVVDPDGAQIERMAPETAEPSTEGIDGDGEDDSVVSITGLRQLPSQQETASVALDSSAIARSSNAPTAEAPMATAAAAGAVVQATMTPVDLTPARARWPLWLAGGAALLLIVSVTLWLLLRSDEQPPDSQGLASTAIVGNADAGVAVEIDASPAVVRIDHGAARAPDAASAPPATDLASAPAADASPADAGATAKPDVAARPRVNRALLRRRARRTYIRRASLLLRRKKNAASRALLTRALKISDDHIVRGLLARSHEQAGELWPAAYHLKRAVALSPARSRGRLLDRLGLVYARLGKRALACQQLRAALRATPPFKGAEAHVKRHCR